LGEVDLQRRVRHVVARRQTGKGHEQAAQLPPMLPAHRHATGHHETIAGLQPQVETLALQGQLASLHDPQLDPREVFDQEVGADTGRGTHGITRARIMKMHGAPGRQWVVL